jgi:hypothetical protein
MCVCIYMEVRGTHIHLGDLFNLYYPSLMFNILVLAN